MDIESYVNNKKNLIKSNEKYNFENEKLCFQAFYCACMFESDLDILKEIITTQMENILKFSNCNNINPLRSGYILACKFNKNIDIIKYFTNYKIFYY